MKTMCKYLFLMLGIVAAVCLSACGSGDSDADDPAEQKDVSLSQVKMSLLINESEGILTGTPLIKGYSADDIIWTNSNPSVADYDPETGKVTAKEKGETIIYHDCDVCKCPHLSRHREQCQLGREWSVSLLAQVSGKDHQPG